MSGLAIRKVTNIAEFESLRDVWRGVLAKSGDRNIYLTWEWLFTWFKHYGDDKKLSLTLIEDKTKVIGIIPLMSSRYKFGPLRFNILENIGSTFPDYSGAILTERKEEAITAFLTYLRDEKIDGNIALIISQIPQDSQFLSLLRKQSSSFSDSLILYDKVITTCPYLPLPMSSDEYLNSLRRKRRGNLRRALQSLQKSHNVEFKKHTPGGNLKEEMQLFFELSQKRWGTEYAANKSVEQKTREFYLDLATAFEQNGWLDFSFLFADGNAISIVFGFEYNGRFYYANQTFDPAYSRYSPGSQHILHLILEAIEKGVKEFNFLKGDEAYKFFWTRLTRDNRQIILARGSLLGKSWLKLLAPLMRLEEISQRSFRENYHLYLEKRKQQKIGRATGEE
ncbi:hypothetical protein ES706_06298 [subsurface metagenome]